MVGMVEASWSERVASLTGPHRPSSEIAAKLEQVQLLKEALLHGDPALLSELIPRVTELQADRSGPVRKALAEMVGDIGLNHMEFLPQIIPMLASFLKDETPAVARQAITSGSLLFRNLLIKIALQGLYSGIVDDTLKSSWSWMEKFKDLVLPIATQHGSDGIRLLAVRFIEALVLLYTPDPNASPNATGDVDDGGVFNVSWLKGGHPLFNLGDLAMEAGQSLGLLLDQLRFPHVRSLSNSIVIVLIDSLSTIAQKRPAFYGRILPVFLSLDPERCVIKRVQVPGAHHALKSAFVACLKCTHSSAAPWRVRLVEALRAMSSGDLPEQVSSDTSQAMIANKVEILQMKDDKILMQARDEAHVDPRLKRSMYEDATNLSNNDFVSVKRQRPTQPLVQETSEESLRESSDSVGKKKDTASNNLDSGPIQQLVGMFAALAAQGDKAAQHMEILMSSISSDLLAEVVMANMQHLPPSRPADAEMDKSISIVGDKFSAAQSLENAPGNISMFSSAPLVESLLNIPPSSSHDTSKPKVRCEEEGTAIPCDSFVTSSAFTISTTIPVSLAPPDAEVASSTAVLDTNDMDATDGVIPGLESLNSLEEVQESMNASYSSNELQGAGQENLRTCTDVLLLDVSSSSCMSSYVSDMSSPRATVIDVGHEPSAAAVVVSTPYILPKLTVSDANLTDEQKDHLQKEAFERVLEAYKQISPSDFTDIHFLLLAHLAIECPLELDPWGLLQKHILSDYLNHGGHELTLHILYRLYRESEQDQDFLSSRTAISVYDTFLLSVAKALRDTFPASDKSLGRLLAEVPCISEDVLKLLEFLCSPEIKEINDKDFQSGDRVTQGLSTIWNLILQRPSSRDKCLQIALKSTMHHIEEVRMKAIRLVANKLFPMPFLSKRIEDFAYENLRTVVDLSSKERMDIDGPVLEALKDSDAERHSSGGHPSASLSNNEPTLSMQDTSSLVSEAQWCMSLYFALCTKKHSLLGHIFTIYGRITKTAKQAIYRHMPILIRTIGPSPDLLEIISDPPTGCNGLLIQVIQTLIGGMIPSQNLISSVKKAYHVRTKDMDILIPILPFLPKHEIILLFPHFLNLSPDKLQISLACLLQGSPHTGPCLTPTEVLIAIHGIDPEKDGVPLKKIMDACSACFEQRHVYTQQVLAKVLNQLVEQTPLPLLFMRTVIQAIGIFPGLVDFVMEILSRLVSKQIWKYPQLWAGFLKCAVQTKPQSFSVLLQLPAAQLENALNRNPVLKAPLTEHASQTGIRSTLPRSTLVALGLANESQASGQPQTSQSQSQTGDAGSSAAAETAAEVTQESTGLS